jgi:hypothetical protein
VEHEIRHDLSQEQAQRATRKALQNYAERFGAYQPEVQWRTDSEAAVAFTIKGLRLQGGIKVEPACIRLNLDVPFVFRPFKKRAFGVIEREVQGWIAKVKSGEA